MQFSKTKGLLDVLMKERKEKKKKVKVGNNYDNCNYILNQMLPRKFSTYIMCLSRMPAITTTGYLDL